MTVYWRGREWTIRPATQSELDVFMDDKAGMVVESQSLILYNPESPKDIRLQAIIHEAGHIMFPEWSAEPHEKSKSELGVFERDMKAFLDACGVDLSSLLGD